MDEIYNQDSRRNERLKQYNRPTLAPIKPNPSNAKPAAKVAGGKVTPSKSSGQKPSGGPGVTKTPTK